MSGKQVLLEGPQRRQQIGFVYKTADNSFFGQTNGGQPDHSPAGNRAPAARVRRSRMGRIGPHAVIAGLRLGVSEQFEVADGLGVLFRSIQPQMDVAKSLDRVLLAAEAQRRPAANRALSAGCSRSPKHGACPGSRASTSMAASAAARPC